MEFGLHIPDVIAHRGFSAENPENSLISFENAIKAGATAIEGDIRLSKDGEIVMMHDTSVNRTTTGSGRVHQLNWHGELDQFKMKAKLDSPVPLLKQVVDLVIQASSGNVYMVIDIKFDNSVDILDALLTLFESYSADLSQRFIIAIWNMKFLKRAKELFPDYQICFIGLSLSAGARFLDTVDCFNLPFAALADKEGQEFIQQVHAKGKRIFAWTINNTLQMKSCVLRELDGVLGDNVPLLLEHVQVQPKALKSQEEYQSFLASDTYLDPKHTRLYFYLLKKAMSIASSVAIGL